LPYLNPKLLSRDADPSKKRHKGDPANRLEFSQKGYPIDYVKKFSEIDAGGGVLGRFPGSQAMFVVKEFMGNEPK